jgi:DctM-like transporters.
MSMELALLLGSFALLVLIDAPIAVALGLSSALYIAVSGLAPMMIVAQQMIAGIDSFTLLAIPLFLFAGLLMVHGGLHRASSRCSPRLWDNGRAAWRS